MRRFMLFGTAISIAVAASSCGGGGDEAYPQEAQDAFMTSCIAQEGATQAGCQCVLDGLEARLSYEDFKKADTAIVLGQDAPEDIQEDVLEAISECRE